MLKLLIGLIYWITNRFSWYGVILPQKNQTTILKVYCIKYFSGEIGEVQAELAQFCQDLGFVIFLITQLSKSDICYSKSSTPPLIKDKIIFA